MWSLLDAIGASALGGMVVLMVIAINLQMNTLSNDILLSNIIQTNTSETTEILKYDFYKIGYKASGNKITLADSTEIQFFSDIDDNNTVDSIYYFLSQALVDSGQTGNPNYFLYRQANGGASEIYALLASFRLEYYDSLGQTLSYSGLLSQSQRNKIKAIRINMTHSADFMIDSIYQQTDWTSIIRPKNLR